jgi:hypothetical protein
LGDERMKHYIYEGPVFGLQRLMTENWRGETYAVSERKAIGNLKYQFKKQYKLAKTSKIFLPNHLTKEV